MYIMGRGRPIQACSRCQRIKKKCDKGNPCTTCLRSNVLALCVYEEESGLKNVKKNGSFNVFGLSKKFCTKNNKFPFFYDDVRLREILLQTVGNNLYTFSEDRVNFNYRSTPPLPGEREEEALGPLAWSFMERKEPALYMLLHSVRQSKVNNLDPNFSTYVAELELDSKKKRTTEPDAFQKKIENLLPCHGTTWFLIDIFFRHLYMYFPFLDERSFTSEIARITGNKNSQRRLITLSISNYDDYACIGILLVLLRMSYLFLKLESECCRNIDVKIDSAVIEVATSCLNLYNITDDVTMVKLQCGLYLKLYSRMAPEFGEGIQEKKNGLKTSMLVQMAYSLGLNKVGKNLGPREIILRKKLWHIIMIYDMIDAYTIGTPLISNSLFSDIEPINAKKIDDSNSNSVVLEEEKLALQIFHDLRGLLVLLNKILAFIWSLGKGTKLSVFLKTVNSLEVIITEKFGFFLCYLTPIQVKQALMNVCVKSHKAKILLFTKALLLALYLHLTVFYEEKGNSPLKLFYEEKSQTIINAELMPAIKLLSDDMALYFGSGVLLIGTFFLQMINRAHLLNISMYIKLKYHMCHHREIYVSRGEIFMSSYLEEAIRNLEKCIYVFMKSMSKLSEKYFYADKTFNLLKIYLKSVGQDDFYRSSSILGEIPYNTDFLKKLTFIYKLSLASLRLPSNENYTYDISEYTNSESDNSPTEYSNTVLTWDQLYNLLDFFQQIWDNEYACNFDNIFQEPR